MNKIDPYSAQSFFRKYSHKNGNNIHTDSKIKYTNIYSKLVNTANLTQWNIIRCKRLYFPSLLQFLLTVSSFRFILINSLYNLDGLKFVRSLPSSCIYLYKRNIILFYQFWSFLSTNNEKSKEATELLRALTQGEKRTMIVCK